MDFPTYPGYRPRLPYLLLAVALSAPSLAGCQPAMTDSPPHTPAVAGTPDRKYTGTVADWPLFFVSHTFGAACYSTYGCKVRYNDFLHVDDGDDELKPSSESLGSRYPDVLGGGYLGVRNFPPPVEVDWRSLDGSAHHARIDIGELFADGLVRHDVAREDIPERIGISEPEIILEVNNRTINVYMRTHIPLKAPRTPGNPYSDFNNDLMKVFSRTY